MRDHPYLAKYLEGLRRQPDYYPRLDLAAGVEEPNILYPIGMGIFVHIESGGEI